MLTSATSVRRSENLFVVSPRGELLRPSRAFLLGWLRLWRMLTAHRVFLYLKALPTRSIKSWAALKRVSEDMCAAATWASSYTFTRFYRVQLYIIARVLCHSDPRFTRRFSRNRASADTGIHTFFWATQVTLLVILLNLRMCEMEHPVSIIQNAENLSYIHNSR